MRPCVKLLLLAGATVAGGVALSQSAVVSGVRELRLRYEIGRLAEMIPARGRFASFETVSAAARVDREVLLVRAADVLASEPGRSERGLALLAMGHLSDAVKEFESIVETNGTAGAWTDLAAARIEVASASCEPGDWRNVLIAADRAVRLDRTSAAAWADRALALRALGLGAAARESWQTSASNDANAARAELARARAAAIPPSQSTLWNEAYVELQRAVSVSDRATISRIVQTYPQQTRTAAEAEQLTLWGEAMYAGDAAKARTHLRIAREIGQARYALWGDRFLTDAVAAIDDVGDPSRMAYAYVIYRQGRLALRDLKTASAEESLRRAVGMFEIVNSPMSHVAAYYQSCALVEQNKPVAGCDRLSRLDANAVGGQYPALRAQIDWELAVCSGVQGLWDVALTRALDATMLFQRLGEPGSAGATAVVAADVYDYIGQTTLGWRSRVASFEYLGMAGDRSRMQVALAGAVRTAIQQRDWFLAMSLLDVEIDESRATRRPDLMADAMTRRARVNAALGKLDAAFADVAHGRAVARSIPDTDLRAKLEADLDIADGIALRTRDATASLSRLNAAADFYTHSNRQIILPEIYLERARTRMQLTDEDAWSDFAAGIAELERQRESLSDAEMRIGVFDTGKQLFDEGLRLLVQQERWPLVFEYAERSRARSILDQFSVRHFAGESGKPVREWSEVQSRLAPGAAVLVIHVLPEEVLLFSVSRSAVAYRRLYIDAGRLEAMIDRFRNAIQERQPTAIIVRKGTELYDLFLRSVIDDDVGQLAIIGNSFVERVPFAALWDRKRRMYVAERANVVVAPSVTLLMMGASRDRELSRHRLSTIVAAGNPTLSRAYLSQLSILPGAEDEMREMRRQYTTARLLVGQDATKDAWLRAASKADVLHFAGHTLADTANGRSAGLLFAAMKEDPGVLYGHEIARRSFPRVRLVSLAACGTLRGETRSIEGTSSLARAFLVTGVPAVVGTLWDVDDAYSAAFFTRFHRRIAAGQSSVQSLHETQLDFIRSASPRLRHAASWSGIQLYGSTSVLFR